MAWTNISGQTNLSFTPTSAEAGKRIRLKQTATNAAGSVEATSNEVLVAAAAGDALISDTFDTKNTTTWTWGSAPTVSGGRAHFPATAYGQLVSEIRSNTRFNFTDRQVTFEVPARPTASVSTDERFFTCELYPGATPAYGAGSMLRFIIYNNTIEGNYWTGTARGTAGSSLAYSSTNHRWLRIAQFGSDVVWLTSPNGSDWTQIGAVPTSSLPFSLTDMGLMFWGAGAASNSGTYDLDNVEVAAAENVAPPPLQTGTLPAPATPSAYRGTSGTGTIDWMGMHWSTRNGGSGSPGCGGWSSSNVQIIHPSGAPPAGYVRMRITNPTGSFPIGSEIITRHAGFGYGTYISVVEKIEIRNMHHATVIGGLFTYQGGAPGAREADMCETSRWGNLNLTAETGHVVWADNGTQFRKNRFYPPVGHPPVYTHVTEWSPGQFWFRTWEGQGYSGKTPIHETTTTHANYPAFTWGPGQERLHFNFWIQGGSLDASRASHPADEVIVRYVAFIPQGQTVPVF